MNGTHAFHRVALFVLTFATSTVPELCPAADVRPSPAAPPKATVAPGKKNQATKTIAGRVFDAHGKPLPDASVWLIRQDDSNFSLPEPTVIAETQSQADGRFELAPLVADLRKHADDPYADFEIWVWKRGFAVGHWAFFGEPISQPISIFLADEVPLVLQLKTPKGDPCQGASVTPIVATFGYSRAIPKPLQDRLKTKTAADGHVEIHGFNGRLRGLSIEKPEFGTQTLLLSEQATSPLIAKLHNTRSVEGRFIFPKGERVDPSRAIVCLEVASERMTPCKNQRKNHGDWPLFGFWQEFLPTVERDGRFRVSGVLEHGSARVYVKGLPEIPFLFDPTAPPKSPKPVPANGVVKFDLPLMRGVWCNVLIRDAATKKPLPGVDVAIATKRVADHEIGCDEEIVLPDSDSTDSEGRIRLRVRPGDTYRLRCVPCEGYIGWSANNRAVHIPAGVDRFDLPPIELARSCTFGGRLVDADGRSLANTHVRAAWRVDKEPGKKSPVDVVYWTKTDAAGHFQFPDIAADTVMKLTPIRAGVPLAPPMETVARETKSVWLRATRQDLIALSGRIVDAHHKPIAGGQAVVEVDGSPALSPMLVVKGGADGSFRTPALFPKRLKYRLTVRSMLDVVASSDWVCPAVSGAQLSDLIVDRVKHRLGSKLSGDEIVARVNGQPIYARELLERAFVEPLRNGRNLLLATKDLADHVITEQEFRSLQDEAINRYLGSFVRTRLLTQELLATLDSEQKKKIEEAVVKQFDGYAERLKGDFRAQTRDEVDRALRKQGTSLVSLQAEFRYRLLSDEYLRSNSPDQDLIWRKALASYQVHRDDYATGPKVYWQLVEINFDKGRTAELADWGDPKRTGSGWVVSGTSFDPGNASPDAPFAGVPPSKRSSANSDPETQAKEPGSDKSGTVLSGAQRHADELIKSAAAFGEHIGPQKARGSMETALKQLHEGKSFEDVARKFSDAAGAEEGGWQQPTKPESLADKKTADALKQFAEGEMSPIIETDDSVRIVRIISRVPAGVQPFEEVGESIRAQIRRELWQKSLDRLYSEAVIELPFTPSGVLKTDGAFFWEPASPELLKL